MNVTSLINELGKRGIEAIETENRKGRCIAVGNGPLKRAFYIDQYDSFDELLDDCIASIDLEVPPIDIEILTDWNKMKQHVTLGIRPDSDDNVATIPYLDLELFAEYKWHSNDGNMSCKVTKELVNTYGISMDELIKTATDNSVYTCQSLEEKMAELCGNVPNELNMNKRDGFYCISNNLAFHGASALARPDLFKTLADELDDDLYIIPSSIHEVLAIRCGCGGLPEFRLMLRDVNTEEVAEEEILSYEVYRYRRDTGRIQIATN